MESLIIFLILNSSLVLHPDRPGIVHAAVAESPIVVELFTSQGCSSCPAADELLNETIKQSESGGAPVLGLSFHVSYWNYLGWKDPYSSEEFTNRQKKYAEVLKLQSIYTPQMIVNGELEFVGSDESSLATAIARNRKAVPRYQIRAESSMRSTELSVVYSIDPEPGNELLNIALIEPRVQNQVPRGENKGKLLKHFNVVRKLITSRAEKTGKVAITVPGGMDISGGATIVLFIQNQNTLKVLAAVKISSKP